MNAQSVLAQLVKLGALTSNEGVVHHVAQDAWLQDELQQSQLQHQQDAEGNHWITLPGTDARSVVLGSYLQPSGSDPLQQQLSLVVGLETLKALAQRDGGHPPCTLKLVVWAAGTDQGESAVAALRQQNVAAYLELQVVTSPVAGQTSTLLSVVRLEPVEASPRLAALCEEAILEMTGVAAASSPGLASHAATIAAAGIPVAAMSVSSGSGEGASRLHLLEAAEAFGRWAEATLHLVAGDAVDLWAREHRTPHLG